MAKKRGFDFKGFMLAHTEKLVCGVVALCFLFLLWTAFSRDGVKAGIEPADIQAAADRATINVKSTTWENFGDKPQMRNFVEESGWYEVPSEPYQLSVSWNPELFPKQDLRDDPKLYTLQELEAHYDQGPLVLLTGEVVRAKFSKTMGPPPPEVQRQIDEARPPLGKAPAEANTNKIVEGAPAGPVKVTLPGAQVDNEEVSEGRRWIMVTGLLPWQAQIDAYVAKFRNAAGYEQKNDLPLYFGYEVERADVTGGATPEWKQHDKISMRSLQIAMVRWAPLKRSETVAKINRHEIFTWPLPARAITGWGTRDKHSKIPLEMTSAGNNTPMPVPMAVVDPLGGLGEAAGGAAVAEESNPANLEHVSQKMLRYFDFDVLPGRTYQYRFRAALRDPNYVREGSGSNKGLHRVELKLLEERVVQRINDKRAALEKEGLSPEEAERFMPVVYTDWSDVSPAIKVPPELYVLALEAEQPPEGRYNSEPAAKLLVTQYDTTLGLEVGAETQLQRGNLANFTADGIRIINVDHSTLETRKFSFDPNVMLVDVRGGQPLGIGTQTVPTELLLFQFDKGGRLIVADELEDAENVRDFRDRKTQLDKLIPQTDVRPRATTGPRDTDIIN